MPEISESNGPGLGAHWHAAGRAKPCIRCGGVLPLTDFYAYAYVTRQGKPSVRYESRCKECARERRKERSRANPGMDAETSRKRREQNLDQAKADAKAYRQTEHGRRVKARLQRLRKARIRAGGEGVERDPEIRRIYQEAMEVERLIQVCPVFDDPLLTKKIHVDHIVPLAKGGEHIANNLQLLPAGINMRKGAKCPK